LTNTNPGGPVRVHATTNKALISANVGAPNIHLNAPSVNTTTYTGSATGSESITFGSTTNGLTVASLALGEYEIGPQIYMPEHPMVPFFTLKLKRKLFCPNTWWPHRNSCGAHPGKRSKGCITFNVQDGTAETGYQSDDFEHLQDILNNTAPLKNGSLGTIWVGEGKR
jgi:hypothetical protein